MVRTAGVVGVDHEVGLINLDTTLPGTDVTTISLKHVPDVMLGDIIEITVEGTEVVSAKHHQNMTGAANALAA